MPRQSNGKQLVGHRIRGGMVPEESNLERTFDTLLRQIWQSSYMPEKEFQFAKEIGRKWRFDRAWPEHKVAVELEGGVYTQGRHTRGAGFETDCEKYNTATAMGWRVFRLTAGMLAADPYKHISQILKAMGEWHGK